MGACGHREKYFRMTEVDYFDGEEKPSSQRLRPISPSGFPPAPAASCPFRETKKFTPDSLSWETVAVRPREKYHATSKEISIAPRRPAQHADRLRRPSVRP